MLKRKKSFALNVAGVFLLKKQIVSIGEKMRFEIVTKKSNFVVASAVHKTWRDAEHWFDAFLEKNVHAYNYDRYILDTSRVGDI